MRASKSVARVYLAGGIVATCLALTPGVARAQSWLPDQGDSSFSVVYSGTLNKKHYDGDGNEADVGHTRSEIWTIGGSYSPTDKVMIEASIPFVNARYKGDFPHPPAIAGDIDDGTWHGTLTDLLVTAHYQVSEGPVAFAPYVGIVIPTHDYPTIGHAAPGRGLDEYWLGFYTATSLNEWIPRTYVEMRANYAWVEEVANVSHDRTNLGLELGYYFNPAISARVFMSRQWTDGGIDLPIPPTDPLFPYHDQLGEDEFVNVGGGFSWMMNDRMEIFGLYTESIEGWNSHKVDQRVTLGMTYGSSHARH
jgi:hypothetical protein